MKSLLIFTTGLIYGLLTWSCEKIKYYPDRDYQDVQTRILAHKAGGCGTCPFPEYSVDAADTSMMVIDGIEVDLQISKDRTLWMCHNVGLPACGGLTYPCFPEATDTQIEQLNTCTGGTIYCRLEDIFALMAEKYPDKYISLDVKAWEPCDISSSDIIGMMNAIADEIIYLTAKYDLSHVMVESQTGTFLNYVKRHSSGIECYLTALGDFERGMMLALESGLSGISFKYQFKDAITLRHVQLLRKKGLKIQLWTVNDETTIMEALSINPDFIQTDHVDFFRNQALSLENPSD